MIFHTVMFTWVDGVTDDDVAGLEAALRADVANFPSVTFYACGSDIGLDAKADSFAIIAGAETVDDLKVYLNDEGHKAIAAEWKRLIATLHIVEFESDTYLNG
ncbi:MAG: Dabb family protein [Microbacteriaceae bacterium]